MQPETVDEHNARLNEAVQYWQARATHAEAKARPRAVEKFYSVGEAALLLGFSERWVRDRIRLGEFAGVIDCGSELRIPASSINAFLERHEYLEPGIPARTAGELRRKAAQGQVVAEAARNETCIATERSHTTVIARPLAARA